MSVRNKHKLGEVAMKHVVSSSRKLIIQPAADAPIVIPPEGMTMSKYGANNEAPSVIVVNETETPVSWQGVDHATGVVIVNEVPEDLAHQALDIVESGGQCQQAVRDALDFLAKNGCVDQYTTKLDFVNTKLSPAGRMLDAYTGIVKRDDRDLTPLWREDEILYVAHSGGARVIQSEILLRTYRNPDGTSIVLGEISDGRPENIEE